MLATTELIWCSYYLSPAWKF